MPPLLMHDKEQPVILDAPMMERSRYDHVVDADRDHEDYFDDIPNAGQITEADLEILRNINNRLKQQNEMALDSPASVEDHLRSAHDQLLDRLAHNLEVYHDLQKLKEKQPDEFTTEDLLFVKQLACQDGTCGNGTGSGASIMTLTSAAFASLCLLLY